MIMELGTAFSIHPDTSSKRNVFKSQVQLKTEKNSFLIRLQKYLVTAFGHEMVLEP